MPLLLLSCHDPQCSYCALSSAPVSLQPPWEHGLGIPREAGPALCTWQVFKVITQLTSVTWILFSEDTHYQWGEKQCIINTSVFLDCQNDVRCFSGVPPKKMCTHFFLIGKLCFILLRFNSLEWIIIQNVYTFLGTPYIWCLELSPFLGRVTKPCQS